MRPALHRTRTVKDVATTLRLSIKTVRKLLISGELPGHKYGNKWLISDTALEDYINQLGRRPA